MSPRAKCQRSSALSTLQYLSISLRDLMELNTPSEVKTCQLCGLRNMTGLHSWCPYVSEKSQLSIILKAQLLQVLGVRTLSSGFTGKWCQGLHSIQLKCMKLIQLIYKNELVYKTQAIQRSRRNCQRGEGVRRDSKDKIITEYCIPFAEQMWLKSPSGQSKEERGNLPVRRLALLFRRLNGCLVKATVPLHHPQGKFSCGSS